MSLANPRMPNVLDDAVTSAVIDALHCLRVAIVVYDCDLRLVFANDHVGYLFRSLPPRAQLLGKSYDDVIRLQIAGGEIVDPDAVRDTENYVQYQRARLLGGDYTPQDIRLSDGRIIEIKTRRTPEKGWIALMTDVTHARQSLNRLQAAMAMSADAFAFYDRNDRLTLCNDEYAAINGLASAEELIGVSFNEVIERVGKNSIAKMDTSNWLQRRLEAHSVPAGAMTVELASGTAYLLRDRAAADGGRIVVFTDITEHQRAEKALTEQTRALLDTRRVLAATKAQTVAQANYLADLATKLDQTTASANTTKTTLLRTMSHELKTPLNAIIGFSDLLGSLADQANPDQIREYAGLIHLGGTNLLKLINQILDLTKISAGRYPLNRQMLDAGTMLWQAKDKFDEQAFAKDIRIELEDFPQGLTIFADENAYTTMVNHLVENAVHFTQNGGVVRLSAERVGDVIRISVSDNGPGVKPEDLTRILEPFEQGGRSTHDHPSGAGLGLTLVKAFAELHGGELILESTLGEGFTAALEIPAAE